jgi:hypothetical protein
VSNRWFRFVIALLGLGAASAAGYRIFQHEQQLTSVRTSVQAGERAAESAMTTTAELKATLHAYVAPGQSHDFWTSRATALLDKLRASLIQLDAAATSNGVSPAGELDLVDRLAAVAGRAARYARASQSLMAGEVIFTEGRDVLDALHGAVLRTREDLSQQTEQRTAAIRSEQGLLGLGAAAVMALAILVLVPPGKAAPLSHAEAPPTVEERRESVAPVPARPDPLELVAATVTPEGARPVGSPKVRVGSIAPAPPTPQVSLADAASVCTDLGRVSQTNEIGPLLERASTVLSASGVIVWMATENRDELYAAGSSGYDERLFERIGTIRRDASNLTAAAFRDGASRTSSRGSSSAAALAVPLLSPQGPIGVFSAEVRDVNEIGTDRLALATIFAAQLANLLGSISTPAESAPPAQQAQA